MIKTVNMRQSRDYNTKECYFTFLLMDSDVTVKVKWGDIIKESSQRVTPTHFINIIDLEMLHMRMQQPVAPPK